ncbi:MULTISPECIES: hypothetical protein [Cyanophyceae]|uniref:Uncharacterized protein n=1 Tax=Stenomitos frigidus AS-A4 TaxID=2933935 RepID=A0ABV0KLG8_9CYAN|nr:hypothetical protein [Phormidium sp. FACHB-592]
MSLEESEKAFQASDTQAGADAVPFVPPTFLLSLATAPVLFAFVGGKALTKVVYELSVFSEEVFRGDRLPVLHFPSNTASNPDDSAAP